jgi:hypothetical protein
MEKQYTLNIKDMETAVEWLEKILEGQKDEPFDYQEWKIAFEYALDMEKQQVKTFKTKTDEKDNNTDNNSNSRLHL